MFRLAKGVSVPLSGKKKECYLRKGMLYVESLRRTTLSGEEGEAVTGT